MLFRHHLPVDLESMTKLEEILTTCKWGQFGIALEEATKGPALLKIETKAGKEVGDIHFVFHITKRGNNKLM